MRARAKRGIVGIATIVIVIGLLGISMSRFSCAGDDSAAAIVIDNAEAEDHEDTTMVREWRFTPESPVPPTRPTPADLRPDFVVKFAIDRWPGWAPLVYANDGFEPGKVWTVPGPRPRSFQVALISIDSPAQMREAFATGTIHIGSATVDMLPFMLDELHKAPRTMPRVFQQVDWSNGGDGIVARKDIESLADLKGRTVVVVENSPSHFFLLAALFDAGLQPDQVVLLFAKDASDAVAAFKRDKSIAACPSRAPDIYALTEIDGNKLLVTTKSANQLIADVWFSRADFSAKFPGMNRIFARNIFEAMIALDDDGARQKVARWMADRASVPVGDVLRSLNDLHWTNYAENRAFLLNANNPASFERIYDTASVLHAGLRGGKREISFDQICDFLITRKPGGFEKYAAQPDRYPIHYQPWTVTKIQTDRGAILAKKLAVQFSANSSDPYQKANQGLYDPNVDRVMEEIGRLVGQYGSSRMVIEGHSDASYRAWVGEEQQIELSNDRANAVKQALIKRFSSLRPDQLVTKGIGASRPASVSDPSNHARNRRVEITLYPADAR